MAELAYRNGVELTHARWDSDVQVLINALKPHVDLRHKDPSASDAPVTAADNLAATANLQPGGGAYGSNTCKQGFVWREAFANDIVCVTPESRQQAAADNAAGPSRVVPLP